MNYSRASERGTSKATRSLLVALLVALVSLFAVGCGSSNDDFVVTGNDNTPPPPPAQTGSVTFQLAKAQAATVPQATQELVFEFFDSNSVRVFGPVTRAFSGTITIEGVPTSATLARITALDANGNPLSTSTAIFNVVPGGNVQATVGVPTPTTFDIALAPSPTQLAVNGTQQLALTVVFFNNEGFTLPVPSSSVAGATVNYTSANPAIATVTSTGGLVSGVAVGNTTVNVSFTLNGVTKTDSVRVQVTGGVTPPPVPGAARLELAPTAVTLTNASPSATIAATYFPANATTGQVVTTQTTATGTTSSITYSAGTITSTAVENATANLVVSYTPTGSSAVNATVAVTVSRLPNSGTTPGTPARLEVTPDTLTLATGGPSGPISGQFFPANSTTPQTLATNQLTVTFSGANPPGTENLYSFDGATGVISATGTGGNAAEGNSVTANVFAVVGGVTTTDTIAVTVDSTTANLVASARVISLVGTSLKLPTSSTYPLAIEETLQSGVVQLVPTTDMVTVGAIPGQYTVVSSGSSLTYTTMSGVLTFAATGSANVTITRNNSGAGGGAAANFTLATQSVSATDLVDAPAKKVIFVRTPTTGKVGTSVPYSVQLVYKTGGNQDLTPIYQMTATGGNLTVTNIGGQPAAGFNLGTVSITGLGGGTLGIANPVVLSTGASIGGVNNAADTDFTPVAIDGTP